MLNGLRWRVVTLVAGGKPAGALVDVKHEDQGAEGMSSEAIRKLNNNLPQYSTNTQHTGLTRLSILAKASSSGLNLNEGKLNHLATAYTVEEGMTKTMPVTNRAEPKTQRLVTSDNKSKAQGLVGEIVKVTPTTGGCATAEREVNTVVHGTSSSTQMGASGKEVGVAQPKTLGVDETKVSSQAKQLKRAADWRAMGNHLSKWLQNSQESKSGESPLGHKDNGHTQATAPAVSKGSDQVDGQGAKTMGAFSRGGGPGQSRFDYSDMRWLDGRWREEKDIEGPGAGTFVTVVGLQVDGRWNDGVLTGAYLRQWGTRGGLGRMRPAVPGHF